MCLPSSLSNDCFCEAGYASVCHPRYMDRPPESNFCICDGRSQSQTSRTDSLNCVGRSRDELHDLSEPIYFSRGPRKEQIRKQPRCAHNRCLHQARNIRIPVNYTLPTIAGSLSAQPLLAPEQSFQAISYYLEGSLQVLHQRIIAGAWRPFDPKFT